MAEMIEIETPAGTAEAYLARPEGESRGGVVFFMDAIGLRPRIGEMADQIASWGYTVLAPNVFYRTVTAEALRPKKDLRVAENREEFFATSGVMQHMQALTSDKAAEDAEAWVAALEHYAGDGPIGTTGYCMGARLSTRLGGQYPDKVVAVGGFHGGGLVTEEPDSPHHAVASSRAEFVYGHADNDGSMQPEAVAKLEDALTAAGRPHLNAIYPDAPHGYTMADTSMWHAVSAERHFTELQALLQRTLG